MPIVYRQNAGLRVKLTLFPCHNEKKQGQGPVCRGSGLVKLMNQNGETMLTER